MWLPAAWLLAAGTPGGSVTSAYRRPASARNLAQADLPPNLSCGSAHGCAEQVHLALGGAGEMVVVWVNRDDAAASRVRYWGADGSVRTATGQAAAYSQQITWWEALVAPTMGAPELTVGQIRSAQDTSSWAVSSFFPGNVSDAYNNASTINYNVGSYMNPAEIYTSPLVHTVVLRGLAAGASYGYRVDGDARAFSFTMPPDGPAFPFTLGLTADIGQTNVSRANAAVLRRTMGTAQPYAGVVLLAGDLSYADGYLPRWDTFGRMLEPLASEVPVMATGGNHEIASGEGWASYNARYPMPYRQATRRCCCDVVVAARVDGACCLRRAARRPTYGGRATWAPSTSSRCAATPPPTPTRCRAAGSAAISPRSTARARRGWS